MSTGTSSGESRVRSANIRMAAIGGFFGGVMGAVVSACVNGTLVGFPSDETTNVVNHAITGLASGFFAGFVGLLVHMRKTGATGRSSLDQG